MRLTQSPIKPRTFNPIFNWDDYAAAIRTAALISGDCRETAAELAEEIYDAVQKGSWSKNLDIDWVKVDIMMEEIGDPFLDKITIPKVK